MNTKELTIKQRKFVEEYLRHGNGTKAYSTVYKVVGQTASVSASKMLRNAKVADEIEARRSVLSKEIEEETKVSVQSVIDELAKGAFAKIPIADMKFSDKLKCLELLAKNLGMLDGKTPPEDKGSLKEQVQEALDRVIKD